MKVLFCEISCTITLSRPKRQGPTELHQTLLRTIVIVMWGGENVPGNNGYMALLRTIKN